MLVLALKTFWMIQLELIDLMWVPLEFNFFVSIVTHVEVVLMFVLSLPSLCQPLSHIERLIMLIATINLGKRLQR